MWSWPLTSPMTLTLDFFKVKFWNSCFSGIVSLIDVKQKGEILVRLYDLALWPHPWPWRFKVKVWNRLNSGIGGTIDMERKGCESSIHDHDIWPLCDHGGVSGLPDSDRSDFRRQHAIDIISSLPVLCLTKKMIYTCTCEHTMIYHKQFILWYLKIQMVYSVEISKSGPFFFKFLNEVHWSNYMCTVLHAKIYFFSFFLLSYSEKWCALNVCDWINHYIGKRCP